MSGRYPPNLRSVLPDKFLRAEIPIDIAAGGPLTVQIFSLPGACIADPGGAVMFEERHDFYKPGSEFDRLGGLFWRESLNRSGAWSLMGWNGQKFDLLALDTNSLDVVVSVIAGAKVWTLLNPLQMAVKGSIFLTADKMLTSREGVISLPEPSP